MHIILKRDALSRFEVREIDSLKIHLMPIRASLMLGRTKNGHDRGRPL